MSLWFKPLFSLSVTHEYYGGACPDFEFLFPDATRRLIRNGRLLIKQVGHTLHCVFEANEQGDAIKPLAGETLRLGLKLRNPHFSNFTKWALDGLAPLYRNRAAPAQLDGPLGVQLAGSVIVHTITKGSRPVTLTLKDAANAVLQTDPVDSRDVKQYSFVDGLLKDGRALLPGAYTVSEAYPATTGEVPYYVDSELMSAGVFGVVELELHSGFHATPPAFEIAFEARAEKLKYYVVATRYGDTDFAKLDVSDQGFGEEQRPEVKFTRVTSNNFASDDLSPALVGTGNDKVALFRSNTAQPRLAKARSKIQLKRNNEVLIQHLPAPTEHQAQADLIIHVAKP